MSVLTSFLGRGLLAGGAAGLVSGGFSWLVAEPVMDQAVELEEARTKAEHASSLEAHAEVFSRDTQHLGLLVAMLVTGVALGLLFALVYAFVHRTDPDGKPWTRSLSMASAAFVGAWLLPFLRYPANPPGVGEPGTVDSRSNAWMLAMLIGLAAVVVAAIVHQTLVSRGVSAPVRLLVTVAVPVVALGVLFLLPDNTDPVSAPDDLMLTFRVLSAVTMLLLWVVLGTSFGFLGRRVADRQATVPAAA